VALSQWLQGCAGAEAGRSQGEQSVKKVILLCQQHPTKET